MTNNLTGAIILAISDQIIWILNNFIYKYGPLDSIGYI